MYQACMNANVKTHNRSYSSVRYLDSNMKNQKTSKASFLALHLYNFNEAVSNYT